MSILFLVLSVIGALYTLNGLKPLRRPWWLKVPSFLAGWATNELAPHVLVVQIVVVALFAWGGALDGLPGRVGLVITLASWAGLIVMTVVQLRAKRVVERALEEGLGQGYRSRVAPELRPHLEGGLPVGQLLVPFVVRHGDVERVRDVTYGRAGGTDLKLDVYRHVSRPSGCPVLLRSTAANG